MKTQEIEFDEKEVFITVEVCQDGAIRRATQYNYAFDTHDDVTERVKESKKWRDKIAEAFRDLEWGHDWESDMQAAQEWQLAQITNRLLG